jgi:hypothetical protein
MVLVRDKLQKEGLQTMTLEFHTDAGFSAWTGPHKPMIQKHFETWDSALLAILIGDDAVPGTSES